MRQLAQQLAYLDDARWVQPVGWLVEEQESRVVQHRLRQPQPLRVAEGERPRAPVGVGGQALNRSMMRSTGVEDRAVHASRRNTSRFSRTVSSG